MELVDFAPRDRAGLLEVDWDKALWTMRRLHLDTLQANALTKWACYPTKLVQRHPELWTAACPPEKPG